MSSTQTPRQNRSNSLQRMLELEKQAMSQRLHAHPAHASPPASPREVEKLVSRPALKTSQTEPVPLKPIDNGNQTRRKSSSRPPPLVINFGHPRLDKGESSGNPTSDGTRDTPFVTVISEKPSSKVVAFQFPPEVENRKSVCDSPTWEAYDRQKKEKKDKKEDKKAQDQAAKKSAPEKKKRLSKPPPASQNALSQVYSPAATSPVHHQRSRSASALGLQLPVEPESPARATRTRTGSFTSLMKSFEVRRSSFDHKRDSGFMGGVKLEQHIQEAEQRALEAELKAIESNIHPALRKPKLNARASSPLRGRPSASRTSSDEAGQKAYPPITRQPVPSKPRSWSFSSQLGLSDMSAIEKLRARVGLKTTSKQEKAEPVASKMEKTGAEAVSRTSMSNLRRETSGPNSALGTPVVSNPTLPKQPADAVCDNKELPIVKPLTLRARSGTQEGETRKPNHPESPRIDDKEVQRKGQPHGKQAKPSRQPESTQLSVHLAPPRKSSKRNMTAATHNSCAPLSSPTKRPDSHHETPGSPTDYFANSSGTYSPPELELGMFSDHALIQPRPHWSSSDDSYSEASRYSMDIGTPNTAHSQSEQDLCPPPLDMDKRPVLDPKGSYTKLPIPQNSVPASPTTSTRSGHRQTTRDLQLQHDIDLERIQAAAKKVLAAFPESSASSTTDKGPSQPATTASAGLVQKLKHQSWRPKERSKLGQIPTPPESESDDPSKVLAPRRAIPAKVASKSASNLQATRKGPPAPLSLPSWKGGPGSPTSLSPASFPSPSLRSHKSSISSPDVLAKTPTRSKASDAGDQVAKMFVECCGCKYYHDMPSRLYEAMVTPDTVLNAGDSRYAGSISMTIKCPWCKHEMSTKCCAGLAAMVYIKERLH